MDLNEDNIFLEDEESHNCMFDSIETVKTESGNLSFSDEEAKKGKSTIERFNTMLYMLKTFKHSSNM